MTHHGADGATVSHVLSAKSTRTAPLAVPLYRAAIDRAVLPLCRAACAAQVPGAVARRWEVAWRRGAAAPLEAVARHPRGKEDLASKGETLQHSFLFLDLATFSLN